MEIENRTSCYFPYTKESNFLYTMPKKAPELRAGDELLVQVTREAIKPKPLRLFKPEFYRKISGAHNRKPHTRYFREDSIRKAGKVKRVSSKS